MSDSMLAGGSLTRQNITKKNVIIGLLLIAFLLTAFWCQGRRVMNSDCLVLHHWWR